MVNLVCCMKSKDSYNRIVNFEENDRIEWEEFIDDLDNIREKIVYSNYDIAVVDEKLWWKDEAIELFKKKDVQIIPFEGDFEEVIKAIIELIPEEEEEQEEVLNLSTEDPQENKAEDKENIEIRYVTQKEYIETIKKVPVPVYKSMYAGIANQVILVISLSERAGSTFVALNLAKAFSEYNILTSIVEPPFKKPYIFDTVGLEKRLNITEEETVEFYSYPHEINDNSKLEKNRETIDDGIVWVVSDPRKPLIKEWDYLKMMKLLYVSKKASINIVDCGYSFSNESVQAILSEADKILVVIEPLPTEIMQNTEQLEKLIEMKEKGLPIEFVLNKWDKGINKKELINFLNVNPLMYIPYISPEFIYKSTYECNIPYDYDEVREALQKSFYNLLNEMIPKELTSKNQYKNINNKKGILNIFKRLKK